MELLKKGDPQNKNPKRGTPNGDPKNWDPKSGDPKRDTKKGEYNGGFGALNNGNRYQL